MSEAPELLYDAASPVATITLNRPDRLNAWTPAMEDQLRARLAEAAADPEVRAIVITGAGRGFCSGADLKAGGGARTPPAAGEGDFDQRYSYLLGVPKLLVAAINGPAAGVGLCIALYCDLRYMADGAKLTTAFSRRGLIAEHGSAWMLPRLVGPMNALDLLVSGRAVETEEAARLGLVRPLPAAGFLDAVKARAAALVEGVSPRSLGVIKRQIYESFGQKLGEAVIASNAEQALSLQSADFLEGVAAFREGRAAVFPGR